MNPEQSYGYEDAKSDIQAAATRFGLKPDSAFGWRMGSRGAARSSVDVELLPRGAYIQGNKTYTVYVYVVVRGQLVTRLDFRPHTDKGLEIAVKKAIAMIKKWASVVAEAKTKKTNPKTDGWGPSSDGLFYNVTFIKPQSWQANGTGPWAVASIRGVSGSNFAVRLSKRDWDALEADVRRRVGNDYNEAHKLMYEGVLHHPYASDKRGYDPNMGIIKGITAER